MTDQQTEIPVDDVPVKKAAANITKTPSQAVKHEQDAYQFTVLAALPYRTFDPMCCTNFSAEVWRTLDDDVYVTYYHASDCEVWRFV